jgi:hypothetical protein
MRANKYELNIGLTVHAETVHMMPRQTVHNVPRQTVHKQTSLKKENKAFFDFLSNFPNMTVDEAKVLRAWDKALTKNALAKIYLLLLRRLIGKCLNLMLG